MRYRYFRRAAAVLAVPAFAAGLLLAGATAASAGPTPPTRQATPQCQGTFNCVTPDVFSGTENQPEFGLTADAGYFQNAPLVADGVTGGSFTQDWQWTYQGSVGGLFNAGEAPAFGLTAYDNENYGDAGVFSLEATPDGFSSGLCAANINDKLVLRHCRGSKWQMFILAHQCARAITAVDGTFVFSILQAAANGHHFAVNVPEGDEDIAINLKPVTNNNQQNQDWDTDDAGLNGS